MLGRITLVVACAPLVFAGCPDPKPDPRPVPAPPLATEDVPPAEPVALAELLTRIEQAQKDTYPTTATMRRDAHPKHHGCVRASFRVFDNVPAHLAVGVFQPGHTYDAWVRFSNASRIVQPDAEPDARGMAIKLLGVPGAKLLADEHHTQDFALINHPVFFVDDAAHYAAFVRNDLRDQPLNYFLGLRSPKTWQVKGLQIVTQIFGQKVGNPLDTTYHSMTPFLHGDKPQAVKYRARPCLPRHTPTPKTPADDYLRHALAESLSTGDACFRFDVQLQTDAEKMPIEDATTLWDPQLSPFVPMAEIKIFAQQFDTPRQQRFCEDLSYTVWHALPAHRPLGGLNRIRRPVYELVNKLRHTHNGRTRFEPTDLSIPADRP